MLVTTREYARAHGLTPIATVRAIAAAPACRRGSWASARCPRRRRRWTAPRLGLDDVGLIELNEAFAAQSLAVTREWGIADDDPRVNVNGGAIALGHPLGCSGARLVTTLAHELPEREDVRYALATMCIGVGQGIAMVLERA